MTNKRDHRNTNHQIIFYLSDNFYFLNSSITEEIMGDSNMTNLLEMPDYVMKSKMVLEGVLLPVLATFGFLGELKFC